MRERDPWFAGRRAEPILWTYVAVMGATSLAVGFLVGIVAEILVVGAFLLATAPVCIWALRREAAYSQSRPA